MKGSSTMNTNRMPSIVLASASPRRRDLLTDMGLSFTVCPSDADESYPADLTPAEAVSLLAVQKVYAVLPQLRAEQDTLIIGADTLVELDGVPLGKPANEADARHMLTALSGRAHAVHTGLAVYFRGRLTALSETSPVYMRAYGADEIQTYIDSGEPFGKAGSYAIQGEGGKLVHHFEGDITNIIGLPCDTLRRLLHELTGCEV